MSHRNQCLSYRPKRLVQRFDLSLAIVVMKSTYKCFDPRATSSNIAAVGGRKGAYGRDIRTGGTPNGWLCFDPFTTDRSDDFQYDYTPTLYHLLVPLSGCC